ncbi:hypothetical protein SAMN05421636_101259 [Pricia antarctica]|uniref:Outer membrane lipoprotein-sorting protein n=1 Tax=Pricia antarctica TaxID=641691 RepID=A0A1G6WCA6_9FLAO|nr:hypothetical protein [Pricia antarctica]SDD63313.1 hypothetical protein SAMN05421636_101259 [Pricia antarctica]
MRIFLSSLFALVFLGCASYPRKNGFESVKTIQEETLNPYFSDVSKDYIYRAKIEAFDKTFGGLFIVKKLGPAQHRIVFTTEMGNTIFDFTFQGDDFKVNRILKEMDRKILLNILKRDLKALIAEHSPVLQTFNDNGDIVYATKILSKKHYFYRTEGLLKKIVRVGNGKEKVNFIFSGIEEDLAGKIEILHNIFPLTLTLKRI